MSNFNFTENPAYDLNTSLISEVINLYGVSTKFLIIERINKDDAVFGDFTHLKTDSNNVFEMFMLPEISEDWDTSEAAFNSFGLTNFENISLFVARASIDDMEITHVVGNLVVLPNNKVMEISNASWEVPGINNLFTYSDARSVLKLSCKPYDNKLISELDDIDISVDDSTAYETLDSYFSELVTVKDTQDNETEVLASVQTVTKTGNIDTVVSKSIVDKTESSPFGEFD